MIGSESRFGNLLGFESDGKRLSIPPGVLQLPGLCKELFPAIFLCERGVASEKCEQRGRDYTRRDVAEVRY